MLELEETEEIICLFILQVDRGGGVNSGLKVMLLVSSRLRIRSSLLAVMTSVE